MCEVNRTAACGRHHVLDRRASEYKRGGGIERLLRVGLLQHAGRVRCWSRRGQAPPAASGRRSTEYHGIYTMQCSTITQEIAPSASITGHRNGNLCGSPCGEKGDEGFQLDIVGLSKQWVVKSDRKRQRYLRTVADRSIYARLTIRTSQVQVSRRSSTAQG